MKKSELKAIADKYNMQILRNPITQEAHGLTVDSEEEIPELDELAERIEYNPVQVIRTYDIRYHYTIEAPTSWFDLWGWK